MFSAQKSSCQLSRFCLESIGYHTSIQLFTDFSVSHWSQNCTKGPCWFSYGNDVCSTKLYSIAMESISSLFVSYCCTLSICSLYHIWFSTLSVNPAFYRWSESRNVWKKQHNLISDHWIAKCHKDSLSSHEFDVIESSIALPLENRSEKRSLCH